MSVITKIFVVVLTVCAIAFSMLTISFVARTENWKTTATEWHDAAVSEAANARVMAAQLRLTHEQDLAKVVQLTNQIADLTMRHSEQKAQFDELSNKHGQLDAQMSSTLGTLKGLNETLKVTQAQLVSEQDFARKLAARNNELERRNIDLNDRTKELTVSLAMAHQQNRAYKEQISAMEQRLAQVGQAPRMQLPDAAVSVEGGVPSAVPADPARVAPIRGSITEVRGKIASISVGAADGVTRGMTFMIYRPGKEGQQPVYVGTIEISRVDTNAAGGQIVRVNDSVSASAIWFATTQACRGNG